MTATLKKYPFDFQGARILSGADEGLFGWVTANYLLENFVKVGPPGLSSGFFAKGKAPHSSSESCVVGRSCTDVSTISQPDWTSLQPRDITEGPPCLLSPVRVDRAVGPPQEEHGGGHGPGRGLHPDHLRDHAGRGEPRRPGDAEAVRAELPSLHTQLPLLRHERDPHQADFQGPEGTAWPGAPGGRLWCRDRGPHG